MTKAPVVYRFICPDPDGRSYVGSVSDGRKRPDIGIARSNSRLEEAFVRHPPETWAYEVLERAGRQHRAMINKRDLKPMKKPSNA